MSKLLTAAAGTLLGAMLLLMPTAALADGQGCYGKDQPPECSEQAKPAKAKKPPAAKAGGNAPGVAKATPPKPAKQKPPPAAPTVRSTSTRGPGPGTLVVSRDPNNPYGIVNEGHYIPWPQVENGLVCPAGEVPSYEHRWGHYRSGEQYGDNKVPALRPVCVKEKPICPTGTALVFRDASNRVTVAGTAGSTAMCEAAWGNAQGAPRPQAPPAATAVVAPPPPARPRRPGVWDCFDPVPAREESWLGSIFGSSNGGKAKTKPKPAAAATGTKRGCNDKGGLTDGSTGARGTGEIPDAAPRPAVTTTDLPPPPPPVTATVLPGSNTEGKGIGSTRYFSASPGESLCMRPGLSSPVPCTPTTEGTTSAYTPTPTASFSSGTAGLSARTCWETTGGVRKQVTCPDATGAPISLSPNAQCYRVFTASGNTLGTQPCNAEVLPGEHLRPMDK